MNSAVKVVCSVIWLVAMVALINMGLMVLFQWNMFDLEFMRNNEWLVSAIMIISGIAGVLSLVKFAHKCMGGGSWCHSDSKGCGCGMPGCNCHNKGNHSSRM